MRLLPLLLSAHSSAWTAVSNRSEGQERNTNARQCRFCGLVSVEWSEPFHCNGDHADDSPGNVVPACPLCHLAQHPDRPRIGDETTLIWMPEMSQTVLNRLVRGIHLTLHANEETIDARRPPRGTSPTPIAAFRAYRALHERAAPAFDRLGTNSFALLGAALLNLTARQYARRGELLAGVRLLPLGRFFVDQRDIYPDILTAWAARPIPTV